MTGVARPYAVDLGPGPEPATVLERITDRTDVGCLWGDWFGGGVVIVHSPLTVAAPPTHAEAYALLDAQPTLPLDTDPAVIGGGWLTSLGYDPDRTWLGFYPTLLRRGPSGSWAFESLGLPDRDDADAAALADWCRILSPDAPTVAKPWSVGAFTTAAPGGPAAVRAAHLAGVEHALTRIHRGAFYQVNLCTRLVASFGGDVTTCFASMASTLQPAYGALVPGPRPIASFSPELFLRRTGDRVVTSPIKGTTPRTASGGSDQAAALLASTKDAAENVMIVDLMRNDLSRVSRPGSVVVEDLLALEPHPGVWHLVSRVSGTLEAGLTTSDLIAATFPPGSVTGAPKSSALRAIAELEPGSRGVYTGSIGFVPPGARAELNVAIRTFEVDQDTVTLGVGGGITADSVPVREWQECLHKAAALVSAAGSSFVSGLTPAEAPLPPAAADGVFESVLVVDGRALRLSPHLSRLDRSCRDLWALSLPAGVIARARTLLDAHRATENPGRHALRVSARVGADGEVEVEITLRVLGPRTEACRLRLGVRPTVSWRHKWVDRACFATAEERAAPALPYFVVDGVLAETTRGNLFVQAEDGVWCTPPLDEGLLPGVTRRAVLDLLDAAGTPARIETLEPEALHQGRPAFWTSSLSGVVPVSFVDGWSVPVGSAVRGLVERLNRLLGISAGVVDR